jgi:hypothetical protein
MTAPSTPPRTGFAWRSFLALAERLGREVDDEAALRSAISRAYYAVFALAHRRLSDHGCWSSGRDPHQRVWGTYVAADSEQCQEIGNRGFNLRDRRRRADYDDWLGGIPARQAGQGLARARRILDLLDRLDPAESCCPPAAPASDPTRREVAVPDAPTLPVGTRRRMTAPPKPATPTDLDRVRAAYDFADEAEVTARLAEHPCLIPLLLEARGRLAAHFGPEAPVRIDLAFNLQGLDPEFWDRSMFARVITDLPPREALDRLDDFVKEWWLDAGSTACGAGSKAWEWLHFDVE